MDYINRIPFLLALIFSIILGLISYGKDGNTKSVFMIMSISMILFYIIGVYIRRSLLDTIKAVDEKERKRLEAEENKRRQEEEEQNKKREKSVGNNFDFLVDESMGKGINKEEEFNPLPVSEFIKRELN